MQDRYHRRFLRVIQGARGASQARTDARHSLASHEPVFANFCDYFALPCTAKHTCLSSTRVITFHNSSTGHCREVGLHVNLQGMYSIINREDLGSLYYAMRLGPWWQDTAATVESDIQNVPKTHVHTAIGSAS